MLHYWLHVALNNTCKHKFFFNHINVGNKNNIYKKFQKSNTKVAQ